MANDRSSGNAFFIILIGVALFAALAFTFTRGSQQGGEDTNTRQAELAASDIITFAQRVSRTVDAMLRQGFSETQISFEGLKGPYTNAACPSADCKVFVGGKGIQPIYPLDAWLDKSFAAQSAYLNWYITAQICVPGLPDNTCAAPKGNELLLILPYLKRNLCQTINTKIGLANALPAPSVLGSSIGAGTQFDGSFSPTGGATLWDDAALAGKSAGCVFNAGSNSYYFYQVLIAR